MISRFTKRIFLLGAVLSVGACAANPVQTLPELSYGHLSPLRLDVAVVRVVSTYKAPLAAPNVDHLFPTPPQKALRRWAADRLKATGKGGMAKFIIIDASVRETPLTMKEGLKGAFTKQQSERYEARIEARLEITGPARGQSGFAAARVSRSRTVREDITLNERAKIWFDLTEALMRDFNAEIEKNIRQYLGGHLM